MKHCYYYLAAYHCGISTVTGVLDPNGNIITSAAGKVTYYWTDSQGGQSGTQSVNFDAAGTQTVNYTVTVNATGAHWVKLYIDQPNHQLFGPKEFTVN